MKARQKQVVINTKMFLFRFLISSLEKKLRIHVVGKSSWLRFVIGLAGFVVAIVVGFFCYLSTTDVVYTVVYTTLIGSRQ